MGRLCCSLALQERLFSSSTGARSEPFGNRGDPINADRFLYATARCLDVPLLSKDRLMHDYTKAGHTVAVLWGVTP
jgi:hypothetical protein